MISLTDAALSVLGRSFKYFVSVESWLDGELLAESVPVVAAMEETDRSLRVPERVTLTVPRLDRGVSWSPVMADHPLAANGQRLRVQLGVGLDSSRVEWLQRGWFLIQDATVDGDEVQVDAVGLLALVDEARLVSPFQPTGTLVSTLRALVEPALTIMVDDALSDRSVPSDINYDEDRLGAVLELLDAWPADAYVNPAGFLSVMPPDEEGDPVLALTDGVGGTVIRASGSSTRDGAYNAVVARGTDPDGAQIQGVAFDNSTGPKRYGGPFNPLPVPSFFSSPLLTTVDEATAAARTILTRIQRTTSTEYTVSMIPHPALQVGDMVSLTTDDLDAVSCIIEALSLPYTPDGSAQSLRVRSVES